MFARGESYTIKMETVLPESPINKELGAVTSHVQNINSKKKHRFNVYDRCFDKHVFFFFRHVYGEVAAL